MDQQPDNRREKTSPWIKNMDEEMKDELEVLQILQGYEAKRAAAQTPAPQPAPKKAGHARKMRGGKKTAWESLLTIVGNLVPKIGDPVTEIVRKCVFMLALLTLIGSVSYIVNDMVLVPANYDVLMNSIRGQYVPGSTPELTEEEKNFDGYLPGMTDDFKKLFYQNPDIRGWISFKSTTEKKWLDVDYPVMYSGDNEYYLNHDFYKVKSKNGSIFLDYRNDLSTPEAVYKSTIIYGHNMNNAQMFSQLNNLSRSTYYARSAPVIQFNTLFESAQYKVFAVMVLNTREEDGPIFNYLRTSFAGNEDFMQYIADVRARSLYDYNSVDVKEDDQLLLLSTCMPASQAKFKEARLAVVARKVREGEDPSVNTHKIVENTDAIYPLAWYLARGEQPHPFYDGMYEIPPVSSDTEASSDGTTTPTDGTEPVQPGTSESSASTAGSDGTQPSGTKPSGTQPPASTTVPSSEPTSPSSGEEPAPTEPSVEPTEPTEPSVEPTEATDPTEPTEPTDPTTAPTEPEQPPAE